MLKANNVSLLGNFPTATILHQILDTTRYFSLCIPRSPRSYVNRHYTRIYGIYTIYILAVF